MSDIHATTILAVRGKEKLVLVGDGQVSVGDTVMKAKARKIRRLGQAENILAGFAGATADALALFERLETQIGRHSENLQRATIDLAKEWRTDRFLRHLDAMLLVADRRHSFIITGRGDVLQPDHPVAAIGSGGNYALAAALALYPHEPDTEKLARTAMEIAAGICIYTNDELAVETIDVTS